MATWMCILQWNGVLHIVYVRRCLASHRNFTEKAVGIIFVTDVHYKTNQGVNSKAVLNYALRKRMTFWRCGGLSDVKDYLNSYRACPTNGHLVSILVVSGFEVTSPHSGHILAMAVWPYSCNNLAKNRVLQISELFLEQFRRFNDEKLSFRIIC